MMAAAASGPATAVRARDPEAARAALNEQLLQASAYQAQEAAEAARAGGPPGERATRTPAQPRPAARRAGRRRARGRAETVR